MKNVFYDALCNGMTPAQLANEMNTALREYEAMTEKAKREEELRAAVQNAADALNNYVRMVDPDWEDLDVEDIETIANMSVRFRSAINDMLDVMFGVPTCDSSCAKAVEPKMSAEDKAIADFLNFLGV